MSRDDVCLHRMQFVALANVTDHVDDHTGTDGV
jgi:hypothetical protein